MKYIIIIMILLQKLATHNHLIKENIVLNIDMFLMNLKGDNVGIIKMQKNKEVF